MGLTATLDAPLYAGGSTSSDVPARYDCAIAGRAFLFDRLDTFYQQYSRATIPVLRQQSDIQDKPGEQSINPEDLWRRASESWHLGAGQTYFDRPESSPYRFRSSKGVNVWTRYQATLLNTTTQMVANANGNLAMVSVGTQVVGIAGQSLLIIATGSSATITGTPVATPSTLTTDGTNVWVAYGGGGVYQWTGSGAATQYVTTGIASDAVVSYVKSRLFVASLNSLYVVTASGALPAAYFTHAISAFRWTAIEGSPGYIYAAGYSGDKSEIYKTTITSDGVSLSAPIICGELPDGEIVRALQYYLGYLLLGTDKGFRLATIDGSGNLSIGPLVTIGVVRCFEPQDRFVWFGWSAYDATSTGLGRIDLSQFTDSLVPAYASDLMTTSQGTVSSVITTNGLRAFAVWGSGFFIEAATLVASATIDSGLVTYGLPDAKIAVLADVWQANLGTGTVSLAMATDGGSFTTQGGASAAPIAVRSQVGRAFEHRVTLTQATTTTGPNLSRVTLRSYPIPSRGRIITVPLLLAETLDVAGATVVRDPADDLAFLEALALSPSALVTYQEGHQAMSVFVEDVQFRNPSRTSTNDLAGTAVVKLKSIAGL